MQRAAVVVQPSGRPTIGNRFVPPESSDDAVGGAERADGASRVAGFVGCLCRLATTPSSPAPSKRSSHSAATLRSRVMGVRYTGGSTPDRSRSSWARRSCCGVSRELLPSIPADRRRQTTRAILWRAWRRVRRPDGAATGAHRSRAPAALRSQSRRRRPIPRKPVDKGLVQLGEVTIQRTQIAALNVDVALGAEDNRSKAVPLGLEDEAAAGRQGRLPAWPASAR